MGYLRPDWLTIERGGMSGNSHFPNDPKHIAIASAACPAPDFSVRYTQHFSVEAATDLAFNLPNVFLWFFYPHYRAHAIDHPLLDYSGWIKKLFTAKRRRLAAQASLADLNRLADGYFLYPLQLKTDYQIRAHSPFDGQAEAIDRVLCAFAQGADPGCHILIKTHPLDNGLRDWAEICRRSAARHGVGHRVHFVDHGNLADMLKTARGVVTINSTTGIHALLPGLPVKVLGTALFDIAGMTDRQPLADFFRQPQAPDIKLRDAFIRLVATAIQVRGNFYSRAGSDAGADAIAVKLMARTVNEPGGYVDIPPRQARSTL